MDWRPEMQDEAAEKFFRYLESREFKTTFCEDCREVIFPPKVVCPRCLQGHISWRDLPREGVVYAFTYQDRSFRCAYPEVIGLVELKGAGRILTKIDAPYDELSIGMPVELSFFTSRDGLVLHQFKVKRNSGEDGDDLVADSAPTV